MEEGRQEGHGRNTKGFVGQREAQGRAQEGGGCPEQQQGRGKVSQSWIHAGWGQQERLSKGVGGTPGTHGSFKVRGTKPRPHGRGWGEERAPGRPRFWGKGWEKRGCRPRSGEEAGGALSASFLGEKGMERPPRLHWGWGEGKEGTHEGSLVFFGAVRVSEHPQTLLLEGKDFLRPRSGEERVKAIPEGPGKGGVKKKSLGLWGIKTSQRFGVFFFFWSLLWGKNSIRVH